MMVHLLQIEGGGVIKDEVIGILQISLLYQVHLELHRLLFGANFLSIGIGPS